MTEVIYGDEDWNNMDPNVISMKTDGMNYGSTVIVTASTSRLVKLT